MSKSKPARLSKNTQHVNLHIRLNADVFQKLNTLAKEKDWSMSLLANEIIKEYLNKSKGEN